MEDKINQSAISEFLLKEFSDDEVTRFLYFFIFLSFYLAALTGNLLIIFTIAFDHHLHAPMYLFLMNLAAQDLGQVSAIIPNSMVNAIRNTRSISYSECVAQVLFFVSLFSSDFFLLTVMAYDRYIAICRPLHYEMLMNNQVCTRMIASVWIIGFLYGALHTGGTFAPPFCSNDIPQFFCDMSKLRSLVCLDTYQIETGIFAFSSVIEVTCFVFIITSYIYIFTSLFRIPSIEGRHKAFSTCLPHLIVFLLLIFTGSFAYFNSFFSTSSYSDLALTMMYTLVPPIMNPVIYSMRNKEIKKSLLKLLLSVFM